RSHPPRRMNMPSSRSNRPRSNSPMFRRLVRRLLFANRGRLFVILLALSSGAAVSAALLNLQTDAKQRIHSDFSSFGANVFISAKQAELRESPSLHESLLDSIPVFQTDRGRTALKVAFLYLIADLSREGSALSHRVVAVGVKGDVVNSVFPS